jgi:hypothetical protein
VDHRISKILQQDVGLALKIVYLIDLNISLSKPSSTIYLDVNFIEELCINVELVLKTICSQIQCDNLKDKYCVIKKLSTNISWRV